ncbi:MAG: sigma 54-interacting transcriptional regulator [Acidobacteria bacterium]|nr:sigma 54-interacting transcriptional regulator [Acidobacteriota bacterium]
MTGSWILVVAAGGGASRRTISPAGSVVGSGADAGLVLDHPTVSRRHAALEPDGDGVWLEDLGSSNGTRLGGTPITGRVLVGPGDRVHFGSLEARFELTDAREVEAAIELTPPPATTAGTDSATLSVGSVRDFVLQALPQVVGCLETLRRERARTGSRGGADYRGGLALAQAAGDALFHGFPCRALEIRAPGLDDSAILFRGGDAAALEGEDVVRVPAGAVETNVCFTPGLHAGGVVPLIELVTRLVALELPAFEERAHSTSPPVQGTKVELPRPATVDPVVRRIYEEARRVARGDVGVLIRGESGTGKEVLAQFLHRCSPRARGELVVLNCAALPQDLLEAELFGIERGVATGVEARPGKFEIAHGGTLFLDEIGDMAPATQAKILRVLQEGEVFRIGGAAPRAARVRVLAATNRDLGAMIEAGSFRLDLYHRIADCRLTLPPLSERLADLPNLAAHFLARSAKDQGITVRGISKAALEALMTFSWPGNVRQLEREMARAALFLEDGELLQTRHLHDEIATGLGPARSAASGRTLKARLEAHERRVITEALARHDRNVRAAATELGVGRTTLYRRIQELGIEL